MSKELIDKIIFHLKKNVPFSVIVEELGLDFDEQVLVMEVLMNKGFQKSGANGEIVYDSKKRNQPSNFYINNKKRHFKLCLLSDTHLASKWDRIDALNYIYERGTKKAVDYYLHGGDLFEGIVACNNNPQTSLKAEKPIKQVEYCAKHYPRGTVPTIVINGNHEEETLKHHQVDMISELVKLRGDILHLRSTRANLQIGKLRIYMEHGAINNKNNLIKKTLDSYSLEARPRIVITGHSHNRSYEEYNVTHIYQVPSLMLPRCPQIHQKKLSENGVWWLEFELDSKGNITHLIQEPEAISNQLTKKLY